MKSLSTHQLLGSVLCIFFAVVNSAQADTIYFDTYSSPSDNDLVNNFSLNNGAPYSQATSGGITGGLNRST